jgi:hypothetical protein
MFLYNENKDIYIQINRLFDKLNENRVTENAD